MEEKWPSGGFGPDLEELGGIDGLKRLRPGRQVLERLEGLYSVLSSGRRIEILYLLNFTRLTPGTISDVTSMSSNLLAFHLRKLERAGIIRGERDGRNIVYSLTEVGRSLSGPLQK